MSISPLRAAMLDLAHRGSMAHDAALVAYYLTDHSAYSSDYHLQDALKQADQITQIAAEIRAILTPDPAPVALVEEAA